MFLYSIPYGKTISIFRLCSKRFLQTPPSLAMSTVHMANEKCKWEGLNQNREKQFNKTKMVLTPQSHRTIQVNIFAKHLFEVMHIWKSLKYLKNNKIVFWELSRFRLIFFFKKCMPAKYSFKRLKTFKILFCFLFFS